MPYLFTLMLSPHRIKPSLSVAPSPSRSSYPSQSLYLVTVLSAYLWLSPFFVLLSLVIPPPSLFVLRADARVLRGYVENRKMVFNGIGKWAIKDGLSLSVRGRKRVAIAHFVAHRVEVLLCPRPLSSLLRVDACSLVKRLVRLCVARFRNALLCVLAESRHGASCPWP